MNQYILNDLMKITTVEVDDTKLWNGAIVRDRKGRLREVFIIPDDKTISQCVADGTFDLNKHVDYSTFKLNPKLFTYVPEENEI
jgi:hypothetical protein